ncbi:MAG: hypothetical protein JWL81_1322 [Verrucomicrobiales bacterium]|nr:hypothetical protein [Verrucomicrobiales bacterium]
MPDFPALILGLGLSAFGSAALAGAPVSRDEKSAGGEAMPELNAAEVQQTLQWLKDHAPDPATLSQDALNRAALQQLLASGKTGATLLPATSAAPPASGPGTLWGPAGGGAVYVRKGMGDAAGKLDALRHYLSDLPAEMKVVILDLRVPGGEEKLAGAADWAGLFLPAGTPLFHLRSSASAPPVAVAVGDTGAPVWKRRVWLLVDGESGPAAELLAHCLVRHRVADLTFGAPTPGTMLEYKNQPMGKAWVLRLPSLSVDWPDGTRLSGTSLNPSIPIKSTPGPKAALMSLTDPARLAEYLLEKEPARPSEAALLAGTPVELLSPDLTAPAAPDPTAAARPDAVLQQARDLVLTADFLNLDAPVEIKRAEPGK